jgi:cytoskeletal protein CcmA (bactofilin family)
LVVLGDIEAEDDLVIEGRVRGHVRSERASVTVAIDAHVTGDVVARAISVAGHVTGSLTATERIEIEPTADVKARIIAAKFVLRDGALFSGAVHVQQLEAASSVARYRARDTEPQPVARRAG